MAKKITTEECIKRFREIHKDEYIYNDVQYKGINSYVKIICKIHGPFWQTPHNHLAGKGCPFCGTKRVWEKRKNERVTFEDFIQRSKAIHGDKYVYDKDKINYVNTTTPINILCRLHGEFSQRPKNHMKGQGCPECAKIVSRQKQNKTIETFIKDAQHIHKNEYLYNEAEYVNNYTPLKIICRIHGPFWQTPNEHLRGQGCPECGRIKHSGLLEFISKAKSLHHDKYIYDEDKINYVNSKTKVCITCREHGDFWQTPSNHLKGQGCPECAKLTIKNKLAYNTEIYTNKANIVHQEKYIYDKTIYRDSKSKICITCPIHGDFWQEPDAHLQGHGCPMCAKNISNAEAEINDYINNNCNIQTLTRNRGLLKGHLECDIVIPSHNIAIEYDGIIWHSEKFGKDKNYHLYKTELAESKGYHLIHVFEDEWLEHKDIVLNKIRHILGCDTDKPVIGARKCTVKTLSKALSEEFLNMYHLQGFVPSTAYYGAFYGDILIGVMTFKQEKPNMWNLTRFATNTDYRLPGLANKMFKQFIKNNNPIEVKTFLDRRWGQCTENVYNKMGFELVEALPPDYKYVVRRQRVHKFNFRKQILSKKYNLPLTMTEREMTEQLGFYRIWDCGLYKYVWKPSNSV